MNPLLEDRLPVLETVELKSGSHADFEAGVCVMELVSYMAGEEFSDHPKCASPVLTSFLIRLNDSLPAELRQKLKPLVPKVIGTRDGRDEERGWMISDWSIRVALPTWLETAGVKDSATALRELPPITEETFKEARLMVRRIRDEAWERRQGWRKKLRDAVEVELKKRGIEKGAAAAAADAVAAAGAAADAAAVAGAGAAADAAAAAAAAAGAAADAAAVAVAGAAADAAAVADADADADPWGSPYNAVYKKVKPIYEKAIGDKYEPVQTELLGSAITLIERMCDLP
jgi:hypothetical protein